MMGPWAPRFGGSEPHRPHEVTASRLYQEEYNYCILLQCLYTEPSKQFSLNNKVNFCKRITKRFPSNGPWNSASEYVKKF